MPSHLTRRVIRKLLANEPIVHRGCLRRQAYSTSRRIAEPSSRPTAHHGLQLHTPTVPRRTFINMFNPQGSSGTVRSMDPGIEQMMLLEKLQSLNARTMAVHPIAQAVRDFIAHSKEHGMGINDFQVKLLLRSLLFCHEARQKDAHLNERMPQYVGYHTFDDAAAVLAARPYKWTESHLEFAEALWRLHPRRNRPWPHRWLAATRIYTRILSALGQPEKARDILLEEEKLHLSLPGPPPSLAAQPNSEEFKDSLSAMVEEAAAFEREVEVKEEEDYDGFWLVDGVPFDEVYKPLWIGVLSGFLRKGTQEDIDRTFAILQDAGLDKHRDVVSAMLSHSLEKNDAAGVEKWMQASLDVWRDSPREYYEDLQSFKTDLRAVLKWALRNQQLDYGHRIIKEILKDNPEKPIWDSIFVWAAGTGKGPDEINRMFSVMESTNDESTPWEKRKRANNATINALVAFAINEKDNPYLAERFLTIGRNRGIHPDARSYVLQMLYRIKVGDIDGALSAYRNMQSVPLGNTNPAPALNKLITAMCDANLHDFDTIMDLVADLSEGKMHFEATTVARLAILHLNRDEIHDVTDLLNTHAFHYSNDERNLIRDSLLTYMSDPKTGALRAWDAWVVMKQMFNESGRTKRTAAMLAFFTQGRPDMAANVFISMRHHGRPDVIPTIGTYIAFYLSCAKHKSFESLQVIHNQMKLDDKINFKTRVYNALIYAYTACEEPRAGLALWREIAASIEGPNVETIHVVMRACEKAPLGDRAAKEIWSQIRTRGVVLTQDLWASYIAALAGNGDNALAIATIEEAVEREEAVIDRFLVASLYDVALGPAKQDEIRVWAEEKYPEVWREVEEMGIVENEDGYKFVTGLERMRDVAPPWPLGGLDGAAKEKERGQ